MTQNDPGATHALQSTSAQTPGLLRDLRFVLLLIMGGGHSYIFTGWEIAYPLIARLPADESGENWTTADIGLTFLVGSVGLMLYSLAFYPALTKRLSVIRLWCWSMTLALPVLTVFP